MPKLPDLPDIPGKSLIGGTTRRARVVAAAGAGAALAVGGMVAKRVLGHGGKDEGATDRGDRAPAEADDKVVPIAKEKAPPKPKPAKPKAAKVNPKAASKPKAAPKPDSGKAKPPKPLEGDPEHPEGGRPPRRENLDQ